MAQYAPPISAQTPVAQSKPVAMSTAPTPVPASTPMPPLGGPLTPFPALSEPRSDDEVAEQWSRGMAMLHDENLAQVYNLTIMSHIIAAVTGESNQAAAGPTTSAKSAKTGNEHRIGNPWLCSMQKSTLLVVHMTWHRLVQSHVHVSSGKLLLNCHF